MAAVNTPVTPALGAGGDGFDAAASPRVDEDDHFARAARMEELQVIAVTLDDQKKKLRKQERQLDEMSASLDRREASVQGAAKIEMDQMCRHEHLKARQYKLSLAGTLEDIYAGTEGRRDEVAKGKGSLERRLDELVAGARRFAEENTAFENAEVERKEAIEAEANEIDGEERYVKDELDQVKAWLSKVRGELAEHKEVENHRLAVALHSAHRFHEENVVLTDEEKELTGKEAEASIKLDRQRKQMRHLVDLNAHISREHAHYTLWDKLVDTSRQATMSELAHQRLLCGGTQQRIKAIKQQSAAEEEKVEDVQAARKRLADKEAEVTRLREEADALRVEVEREQEAIRARSAAVQKRAKELAVRQEQAAAQRASLEDRRAALTARDDEIEGRRRRLKQNADTVTQWRNVLHHRERLLARAEQGQKVPSLWRHPMPLQTAPSRSDALQHRYLVTLRQERADASKAGIQRTARLAVAKDMGRLSPTDLTPVPARAGPVRSEDHIGVFFRRDAGRGCVDGIGTSVLRATAKVGADAALNKLSRRFAECLEVLAQQDAGSFMSESDVQEVSRAAEREIELAEEHRMLELLETCPLNGGSSMHTDHAQLIASMREWWALCCDARDRVISDARTQREMFLADALSIVARRTPEVFDERDEGGQRLPHRHHAADALLVAMQPARTGPPRTKTCVSPMKAVAR